MNQSSIEQDKQAFIQLYADSVHELENPGNGWLVCTTQFLDRHNDYIQVCVRKYGDDWEISDDGYLHKELLDRYGDNDAKKILASYLKDTTIEQCDPCISGHIELRCFPSEDKLIQSLHTLIQAIIVLVNQE